MSVVGFIQCDLERDFNVINMGLKIEPLSTTLEARILVLNLEYVISE